MTPHDDHDPFRTSPVVDESGTDVSPRTASLPPAPRCPSPEPRSDFPVTAQDDWPATHGPADDSIPVTGGYVPMPRALPALETAWQPPGYEILSELGKGGMGVVYLARDEKLKRLVAIKRIKTGPEADPLELQMFRREAEAVARLQHPNIVQIHRVDEHLGQPYCVLEYVAGGSLHGRLGGSPQPPREAAQLLEWLAKGMEAAHRAGVVHRDMKPANVLLKAMDGAAMPGEPVAPGASTKRGLEQVPLSALVPKITDFGLAKQLDEVDPLLSGALVGTPSYMAPEQAAGRSREIGPSADVWALGAILYECLTGKPPFRGSTLYETLEQVQKQDPVSVRALQPHCPFDLETICLKCLRKSPAERYGSAAELLADLERFREGRPILARPAGTIERLVKWARRSPAQALAALGGVVSVLALFAVLVIQAHSDRQKVELARLESETQHRIDKVKTDFIANFAKIQPWAEKTPPKDVKTWANIEADLKAALIPVEREPTLQDFPLLAPAKRLVARATDLRQNAARRKAEEDRLRLLEDDYRDAVFFGTLFTGADLPNSLARTHKAVAAGLQRYGTTLQDDGPPKIDATFVTASEAAVITSTCYELLLLEADALAHQIPGEEPEVWHARLRRALELLDRAGRLLPGPPPHSALSLRARFLGFLGDRLAETDARNQAAATPVRSATDYFFRGLLRYEDGELEPAAGDFLEAQRLNHPGADYLLAVCMLRQRRFNEARALLDGCLEKRPNFAWAKLQRGHAEMELKRYDAARKDFEDVLTGQLDATARYVALVNVGALGIRQRRWTDAITSLQKAIQANPEALPAYINLALAHRESVEPDPLDCLALWPTTRGVLLVGREVQRRQAWKQAVAVLDEAIRHQPRIGRLYHERAQLFLRLDEREKAIADLGRAILLDPAQGPASIQVEAYLTLGRLLHRTGKHVEAVQAFQAVRKLRPTELLADRLIAEPLLALKRHREAAAALDRFLEAARTGINRLPRGQAIDLVASACKTRGLLYVREGDLSAAVACYTRGLFWRRDIEALGFRARAYLAMNASNLALADFDLVLKERPDDVDAMLGRAEARVRQGKLDQGLADAVAGLRLGPVTPRLLYQASRVHVLAAGRVRSGATGREDLLQATRYDSMGSEYLRRALTGLPLDEREAFWRDYVEKDSVMRPLRSDARLRALVTARR